MKSLPPEVAEEIRRQERSLEANVDPPDRWIGSYNCIFWQACEQFGLDPHEYRAGLPKTYDMLVSHYPGHHYPWT
jgi:hypothetical protein